MTGKEGITNRRKHREEFIDLDLRPLVARLREIADWLDDEPPGKPATMTAGWHHTIEDGLEISMGEVTVQTGAPAKKATVTFFDVDGNPVEPDATPSWSSSDEAVATVAAAEGGLTASVSFAGPGSAIIECATDETAEDGTVTTVRATGMVNVDDPDVDATTGTVEFTDEEPAA